MGMKLRTSKVMKLIGKQSVKRKRKRKGLKGRETEREFCNNINSFQTMSKEPWQHGLKQTLPLIL